MHKFDRLMYTLNQIRFPKGKLKATDIKKQVQKLFADIKFSIERTDTLKNGDYAIAGFYLEEVERIEIVLLISSSSKGYLTVEHPNDFRFHLAQTIHHEYVHHQQFIKRDKLSINSYSLCLKGNKQQTYLGERDEIDAYSHDVAIEVREFGWEKSQTIKIYRQQFDSKHPVMKRLLKKAYKNLKVIHE